MDGTNVFTTFGLGNFSQFATFSRF